ncbi:hypothetical protein NJT12_19500 [Flavobacterium sp. AC]|uniref:Uncharacterized protein n=1 Tax=Flavobacterium azizsancarii TaxID=2961580 RepID=A0ABT4WIC5_9FLAO|nr:hypothetical protein [Flavobacterium azizsancarii]MDA6071815.1 hypothetical protein [Flavobacterium azizsancarii]
MRILDNEKAEILGSLLTSGFGVSALGASTTSLFFAVSTSGAVVFAVSTFGVLTSTIE